jgi:hypothetical protein
MKPVRRFLWKRLRARPPGNIRVITEDAKVLSPQLLIQTHMPDYCLLSAYLFRIKVPNIFVIYPLPYTYTGK